MRYHAWVLLEARASGLAPSLSPRVPVVACRVKNPTAWLRLGQPLPPGFAPVRPASQLVMPSEVLYASVIAALTRDRLLRIEGRFRTRKQCRGPRVGRHMLPASVLWKTCPDDPTANETNSHPSFTALQIAQTGLGYKAVSPPIARHSTGLRNPSIQPRRYFLGIRPRDMALRKQMVTWSRPSGPTYTARTTISAMA